MITISQPLRRKACGSGCQHAMRPPQQPFFFFFLFFVIDFFPSHYCFLFRESSCMSVRGFWVHRVLIVTLSQNYFWIYKGIYIHIIVCFFHSQRILGWFFLLGKLDVLTWSAACALISTSAKLSFPIDHMKSRKPYWCTFWGTQFLIQSQ